jgi:hypothetical protein
MIDANAPPYEVNLSPSETYPSPCEINFRFLLTIPSFHPNPYLISISFGFDSLRALFSSDFSHTWRQWPLPVHGIFVAFASVKAS